MNEKKKREILGKCPMSGVSCARGCPRSGNDANLSLEHFYFEKKNTFTFSDTTDVRSTLQKLFNIEILRI